jgi:hypothetical protein
MEYSMTKIGNVILRATYNQEHDSDPVAVMGATDKLGKVDVRFIW